MRALTEKSRHRQMVTKTAYRASLTGGQNVYVARGRRPDYS